MKKLNLRIPEDLHSRLKTAADKDHRSINSMILALIERGLPEAEQDRPTSPPP